MVNVQYSSDLLFGHWSLVICNLKLGPVIARSKTYPH